MPSFLNCCTFLMHALTVGSTPGAYEHGPPASGLIGTAEPRCLQRVTVHAHHPPRDSLICPGALPPPVANAALRKLVPASLHRHRGTTWHGPGPPPTRTMLTALGPGNGCYATPPAPPRIVRHMFSSLTLTGNDGQLHFFSFPAGIVKARTGHLMQRIHSIRRP